MPLPGMHTTLGCAAIACTFFALWLVLAADLLLDDVGAGIIAAAAVAIWARLVEG
jgi:hypothetical protein